MVMQAISVCCVKVPCESVLESLVSIFDNHFNAIRNMNKESTTQDFMIHCTELDIYKKFGIKGNTFEIWSLISTSLYNL